MILWRCKIFNRPGVAGAVLQTPLSLIWSSFSSRSSNHFPAQTKRARELKFWENVYPPPNVTCHVSHVICHMSCVTCHMARVTCHVSCVTCHIILLLLLLIICLQSGGASRGRVCYQRGLPRLVSTLVEMPNNYLVLPFNTSHQVSLRIEASKCTE